MWLFSAGERRGGSRVGGWRGEAMCEGAALGCLHGGGAEKMARQV